MIPNSKALDKIVSELQAIGVNVGVGVIMTILLIWEKLKSGDKHGQ